MLKKSRPAGCSGCTIIAVLGILASASCATMVRVADAVESERLLPEGAAVYARLDAGSVDAVLGRLGGSSPLDGRTDVLTVAVSADGSFSAVAEGGFPGAAMNAGLAVDRSWRRHGSVWERTDGLMSVARTSDGRLLVSSDGIDAMLAAAAAPHPHPVPPQWIEAWRGSVVVYVTDPLAMMTGRVPFDGSDVPLLSMILSAVPAGGGLYTAELSFAFASARAALVFTPLCRVFLYAAAHWLWPERAATVLDSAVWETDGPVVRASALPLDASSLAELVVAGVVSGTR